MREGSTGVQDRADHSAATPTDQRSTPDAGMAFRRFLRRACGAAAGTSAIAYTVAATTDLYKGPIGRYIQSLDPEDAHDLAIRLAKYNLAAPPPLPFISRRPPAELRTTVWGMEFDHPIGLAAGFDKHAEAMPGIFRMGFSFVEVGSVTPRPQPGNPRPRVFRLRDDDGVLNRYGFNSHGADSVFARLYKFDHGGRSQHMFGPIGVNLGKNKDTPNDRAVDDYLFGLNKFGDIAEYIVVNVSSPNTPSLRDLQGKHELRALLRPLIDRRRSLMFRTPILVKIAPDLSDDELADICIVAQELGIDGIIVSNTTMDKSMLKTPGFAHEAGGVSGQPVKHKSTAMVAKVYRLTDGKIPIVGVGGVQSGQDAYDKIKAGASLVQLYTALTYHGPWVVRRIQDELTQLLKDDGFDNVQQAIGIDHRR